MLTAVLSGQGSNPGKGMDVCKCLVPSWHGGTLNSCRGWGKGKRGGRPLTTSRVFSLKIGVEPSQIELSSAWYSKLRLMMGVYHRQTGGISNNRFVLIGLN
ncbi:hypothetical protein TNCV_2342691 [Trichonephila clavipes]|nr:hypothetical protein TNCV_2342691 [Trichonephila clavipes]